MRRIAGALSVLAAAVLAAFPRASAADDTRDTERHISQWDPASEDAYQPPSCIRAKGVQLEGVWSSGGEWDRSELRFTARGSGFDVVFATSWTGIDDVLQWTLKRTARLENGSVTLNRAVDDVRSTYRRLWPLEVGPYRTVALVPTSALDDVRRAFKAGGCTFFNAAFECRACFERRAAARGAP